MTQQLQHITGQPTVLVTEGEIVLDGFIEPDPMVVEAVRESVDPEITVHRILGLGARAAVLAGTTLDTAVVESAFTKLGADFDQRIADATQRITETASGLLDEDGSLPRALETFREDLGKLIETTFDPDSRASAISRLDEVLTTAGERLFVAVRRLLDPDAEDGPLSRYRAELTREIRDSNEATLRAVQELSERVAVRKAEADLFELGTAKGFTFEELVHEALVSAAAPFADVGELVGTTVGATGGKVGDEVVTLSGDDTRGRDLRYVLEYKDRRISSVKAILDEVGVAMANRQALAGIAVFSSQANAPIAAPFQAFGDRAIVVLDKADPNERALALACAWARWVVRRDAEEGADSVDVDRIEAAVEEARRALARVANVRRAHSVAIKKIGEASGQVDVLAEEFEHALAKISEEIASEGSFSTGIDSRNADL